MLSRTKCWQQKSPLTEVGNSQYKSHFLPFFLSHMLLNHSKQTDLHLPDSWDLVKDEAVQKVSSSAAGTNYLRMLYYSYKLLTSPKNPWQVRGGKISALVKRELHCKWGKLCPLVAAERNSASARSVSSGMNEERPFCLLVSRTCEPCC